MRNARLIRWIVHRITVQLNSVRSAWKFYFWKAANPATSPGNPALRKARRILSAISLSVAPNDLALADNIFTPSRWPPAASTVSPIRALVFWSIAPAYSALAITALSNLKNSGSCFFRSSMKLGICAIMRLLCRIFCARGTVLNYSFLSVVQIDTQ